MVITKRIQISMLLFILFMGGADSRSESVCEIFSASVMDDRLPGAYQAVLADINHDGALDVAALGEGESGVYWYENPSWKRRPICEIGLTRFIDFAFYDLDSDGELELALASDFNLSQTQCGGTISWLDRQGDLELPWTVYAIHQEPTAHRVRWADTDGDGKNELIVAPIAGVGSAGPAFDQTPVRLLSFPIPAHPKEDTWNLEVIDDTFHLLHGLYIQKGDPTDAILTASLEGIYTLKRDATGKWGKTELGKGFQETGKLPGSSEITMGVLQGGMSFLTSIEPWHGHQVAVYMPENKEGDVLLRRTVIEERFNAGHALACADFDGDGEDEIIAGYRGEGYSIYYYDYAQEKAMWEGSLVDRGGVAAQGFAVGDVNGDGAIDFVATGGTTHNLKLYLNRSGDKKTLK